MTLYKVEFVKYQSLIKKSKFPGQENQGYAFKATNQAKSITKPLQTDPPLVLSSLSSSQIHGSIPTDANPTANPPREDHICGEAHDKTIFGSNDPLDPQTGITLSNVDRTDAGATLARPVFGSKSPLILTQNSGL